MRQLKLFMKKLVLFLAACFLFEGFLQAQVDTLSPQTPVLTVNNGPEKPKKKKYNLTNRANDHLLVQLGYTGWMGAPDSIQTKGFSKSVNAYFMLDFPFKSNQQLSAAIGLGFGSDHIILDKSFANVKGKTATMRFKDVTNMDIKKTKLGTTYLEAPIELRFVSDPENSDRSFKVALGVKVGTMIKAGTRSRVTEPNTRPYLLKESSKDYFNTTRIVGTARIGVGHFTLFGTYQFTNLLKEGMGPELKPYTFGICFGGL